MAAILSSGWVLYPGLRTKHNQVHACVSANALAKLSLEMAPRKLQRMLSLCWRVRLARGERCVWFQSKMDSGALRFWLTVQKFTNCSCVMYNFTAEDVTTSQYWQVEQGRCENDCPYLPLFLPIFSIIMVGVFITSMPALSASLRYVSVCHQHNWYFNLLSAENLEQLKAAASQCQQKRK